MTQYYGLLKISLPNDFEDQQDMKSKVNMATKYSTKNSGSEGKPPFNFYSAI